MKKIVAMLFIIPAMLLFTSCSDNGGTPDSVSISPDWIALTTAQTRTIHATAHGGNASADFQWHNSDAGVVTVNSGILTPVGPGTATVYATADGIDSEVCTVHVAEDWILYSDGEQLRIITPDDDRDMPIPGTDGSDYTILGPMVWLDYGIAYHTTAAYNYSHIWFRPFDSEEANMITPDTIEPIYDIRANPDGGILLTVYADLHSLDPRITFDQYVNADHLYYSLEGVKLEGFDVNPDGDQFVSTCRFGTIPKMVLFDLDGAASAPTDTLPITYITSCPRYDPAGTHVAYGYRTTVGRLWLIPTDGGIATNIITEGRDIPGLDWSPDGSWIAMCVQNMAGEFELWIGDPATGATTKLIEAAPSTEFYFPQWVD